MNSSDIVTLPCAGQAVEPPSVTWFRGLTGETTLVQSSDRVTILDNRSLIIEVIQTVLTSAVDIMINVHTVLFMTEVSVF